MRHGYLERTFGLNVQDGKIEISCRRFLSLKREEVGAIRYSIRSVDFSGRISFAPYIDGNVVNRDSNYDEKFWEMEETGASSGYGFPERPSTRKTGFITCMTMGYELHLNGITDRKEIPEDHSR